MAKTDLKRSHGADDDAPEASSSSAKRSKTGDGDAKAAKKGKTLGAPLQGQDTEGNMYWELSKTRRIGISHFKNNIFINIREYYESGGQMRPGKKGISLSVDQYKMLAKAIPFINAELRDDNVTLSDADEGHDGKAAATAGGAAASAAASAKEGESNKGKKKAPSKANIEATSDEDSS